LALAGDHYASYRRQVLDGLMELEYHLKILDPPAQMSDDAVDAVRAGAARRLTLRGEDALAFKAPFDLETERTKTAEREGGLG